MSYNKNEIEALKIFRLLTPENKAYLLYLVRLAYAAENSEQVSVVFEGVEFSKPQE